MRPDPDPGKDRRDYESLPFNRESDTAMIVTRALILSILTVYLTGCPASKTQSSSRSVADQAGAGGGVASGEQPSANAESPVAGSSVRENKTEKVKKETPKTVETKTIGDVSVHSDQVAVSEPAAKKEHLTVAIEPVATDEAVAEGAKPAVPAETVPLADLGTTELTPDTEYVVFVVDNAPNGEQTVVEEKVIVTLAQEPEVTEVTELSPGEFRLTLATGDNPLQTVYAIAVVEVSTQEVLAWVSPVTGLPVKTDEERWAPLAAVPTTDQGPEAVVVVKDLGLDPDLIAFAVQARNQSGDETALSETVAPVNQDLLSSGTADPATENAVQVVVPSNAPVPIENQIASGRDEIRELRAKIKKLKAERRDLQKDLKKLQEKRHELAKEIKNDEKDKKSEQKNLGKNISVLDDDIADLKARSDKIKTELKSLQKLLTQKTATLKGLKKKHQSERVSRKS